MLKKIKKICSLGSNPRTHTRPIISVYFYDCPARNLISVDAQIDPKILHCKNK